MVFDREMGGKRVLAQDLAGEEAIDISHSVQIRGNIAAQCDFRGSVCAGFGACIFMKPQRC